MPFINPVNPPNVNEVLRRDAAVRQDAAHFYESSSQPQRKRKLIRALAKLLPGGSGKKER
jgi:hypothetical protein